MYIFLVLYYRMMGRGLFGSGGEGLDEGLVDGG